MLTYAIKSIIYLSLMYIPYMLLLRKESFYRFNRVMLLVIMSLSLLLPLVNIPAISWGESSVEGMLNPHVEFGMPIVAVAQSEGIATPRSINWWLVSYYIYIIGAAVTLVTKVLQSILLYRRIRRGVLWTDVRDGVTIYCHALDTAPYSWFGSVVISNDDYETNPTEILRHEFGHIRCRHSWDIMLLNAVQILQWVNPMAWILGSSLRDVHEYEADSYVLKAGVDMKNYQMLLIRKAIGASSYAFANGFNHSLLSKRITMMLRKKSNPWMRTKALYVILVAAVALSAFATPELNNRVESMVNLPSDSRHKVNESLSHDQTSVQENVIVKTNQPQTQSVQTSAGADIKGPVYIIDGKIESESVFKRLKKADIADVTTLDGAVAAKLFGSKANGGAVIVNTKKGLSEGKVFDVVEGMPTPPGGMDGLMQYLSTSIKYPLAAQEHSVEGTVVVEFVVEKDGSITSAKVVHENTKAVGNGIDAVTITAAKENSAEQTEQDEKALEVARQALRDEAIRVVSAMKPWTPGKQNGKNVRVRYSLPMKFKLN